MSDRETIESALQKVQSGELSPAEATQILLESEQSRGGNATTDKTTEVNHLAASAESLTELVGRLGTAPIDVVDAWSVQLLAIASLYEQQQNKPLPEVELSDCSLDQRGVVTWKGFVAAPGLPRNASVESIQQINGFREQLIPGAKPLSFSREHDTAALNHPDVVDQVSDQDGKQASETSEVDQSSPEAKHDWFGPRVKQGLFVVAVLACCIVGSNVIYNAMQVETTVVSEKPVPTESSQTFSTNVGAFVDGSSNSRNRVVPSTDPMGGGEITAADLETFESMSEAELASFESSATNTKDAFSLDDLMPPAASFLNESDTSAPAVEKIATDPTNHGDSAAKNVNVDSIEETSGLPETDMLGESDDNNPPVESIQETRTSSVSAVELQSIDTIDIATVIAEHEMKSMQLDFPFDVPLELGGTAPNWELRDTRKMTLVGILNSDSTGTKFNWSETARQSPSVSSFAHGRLKDHGGSLVYLRPTIEADAWPLRTDHTDVMPTWNLRHPIPPKVARIQVDFDLPDDVEVGWIEPIESDSVRRTRGLAVLTPKDGETVSLGVRLDVRCSRKLTMRVRFAGRLDSSMPWQVVSESLLEQFANQLTEQAMMVSREKTRLAGVYEMAGSSGRRILRVKQNRNDDRADMIRETSERVAQLQGLLSSLAVNGFLRASVWVEWPDARQDLLLMKAVND